MRRESNLQSRDFSVPLECEERDEIYRYVSKNKSSHNESNRTERPRLEPPAKFSFLSGIHPDLDEALCEIQTPNVSSRQSDYRRMSNERISSEKISSASNFDKRKSTRERSSRKKDYRSSCKTNLHDDMSIENMTEMGFDMKESTFNQGSSHSDNYCSSTSDYLESRAIASAESAVESVFSKPKEITCTSKGMNESVDSLPFSVDGMERAKRRIKSQAVKIRDLEAKLLKAQSPEFKNEVDQEMRIKHVMSPEERLKAHMQRKRQENKYKDESGKWGAPPPLKHENIASKVKRKDKLVDRLVADPTERKRQDEVNKRLRRSMKKFGKPKSDDEGAYEDEDYPIARRMSNEKMKSKKKAKSKKKQKTAGAMPDNLMRRLNMNVKERRGMKKNKDDLTDNLKRTLRGHKIQKKSWRMSQEYDKEKTDDSSEGGESDFSNDENDVVETDIQCATCMAVGKCEEDVDNPGTYYCANCWEDYETNDQFEAKTFVDDEQTDDDKDSYHSEHKHSSKHSRHKEAKYDDALWVVHDNPKLGGTLTWSGSKKMSCLVETKDSERKNCIRILRGMIEYCGSILESGVGNHLIQDTGRGAECIRISDIEGFTIDYDEVETRLSKSKSIYEFRLDPNEAIQLTGQNASMRLKDFFNNCAGAVDVILAPQSSPGGWYPLREAAPNSRKIAPQFRSNGFGYIRLGDDMSKNGLAFLSSDSCSSFFLSVPVEREEIDDELLRTASSFSNKHGKKKLLKRQVNSKSTNQMIRKRGDQVNIRSLKNVRSEVSVSDDESDCSSSSSSSSYYDDEENEESSLDAGALLKELQNFELSKNVKWKEKADLLASLGKAITKPKGRATCSDALSYIQDVISAKNVNINVLRSALSLVEKVGEAMGHELSHHISWKTILIEILKLLKNKQVGSGAKGMLRKLHGRCFTLGNSLTVVSHVLGMGKTTNKKSNQSMQKANNMEAIEWLAVTTEIERHMEEVNPMLDESGLAQLANFFSSHENHRDAKCRKNALDGLLHTVLYGIDRLQMKKTDALNLCLELKTSNPKSWMRLTKGVNNASKEQPRRKR